MTNGPIEQPMSNAELQVAIANLVTATRQTNESVRTLRDDIEAGFDLTRVELQQATNDVACMIVSLGEEIGRTDATVRQNAEQLRRTEATVRQTSEQLQTLIDEGKADRAEAQRQRLSVGGMLQQVLERVNQIWGRLNA
ncbi:MAG: hypothetical protein AAGF01_12650 [Cyanobacteria bacterium P01_G01_bin.38]